MPKRPLQQFIAPFCGLSLFILSMPAISQTPNKQDCLEGNCRNGWGLKKITTTSKDPLRFDQKPMRNGLGLPRYTYYLAGEFRGGELNGNGYRLSLPLWGSEFEKDLRQMFKNKQPLMPNEKTQGWFEQGQYKDNVLNGKGFLIEFNTRNGWPIRIREGQFENGALHGTGMKIKFGDNGLGHKKDEKGRYILQQGRMYEGRFEKDVCKDCTVTEKRTKGEGHMTGKDITENLFSGWVIKDFNVEGGNVIEMNLDGASRLKSMYESPNNFSGSVVNVKPYRALFIGGIEIAKINTNEQSVAIKKVDLGNGVSYYGECDEQGKPFGFGILNDGRGKIYEGMVDNNQPNGYGLFYFLWDNSYREKSAWGGRFLNGKMVYGAFLSRRGEYTEVILGGIDDPMAKTELSPQDNHVYTGPFTKITYKYDEKDWTYSMYREEKGVKKNGIVVDRYVTIGKTDEDKKRQRIVTNSTIKYQDLVIGDIVVVEGMASPVVSYGHGFYYLKNNKTVPGVSTIKLSKYKMTDFEQECNSCRGQGSTTHTYQRNPEQVEQFYYRTEKVVGDFTITTRQVLDKMTVTKSYAPEQRTQSCYTCNGKGYIKDIKELRE